MGYQNYSAVYGKDTNGKFQITNRPDHISEATAVETARTKGWNEPKLSHLIVDLSGKGRGSFTEFTIDVEAGTITKLRTAYVDDSQEVHDLWDEFEGSMH